MNGVGCMSARVGAENFGGASGRGEEHDRAAVAFKAAHKRTRERRLAGTGIAVENESAIVGSRCAAETCQGSDNGHLLVVGRVGQVYKDLGGKFLGSQFLVLQIVGYVGNDAHTFDVGRVLVAVADRELALLRRFDFTEFAV